MAASIRPPVKGGSLPSDAAGGTERAPEAAGTDVRELRVDSVAHGGDGVAREPSGRVVFVPRSAPGDRVRVRIVEERGSWARGRILELLEAGPDRRDAPCPYYASCGGCQLQHLDSGGELRAKRLAVADTLSRIGGREAEVPAVLTGGPRLEYRNRVTLTLRRGREGVQAGYHGFEEPDTLVDVDRCPLAEPAVNRAWEQLRAGWGPAARHLPGGQELRLTVRTSWRGGIGLLVEGGEPGEPGEPGRVSGAVSALESYQWNPDGEPIRSLAGRERLREQWNGQRIEVGPTTFLQVNRWVARLMEEYLDGLLGAGVEGERVLDLYSGMGLRAIRWADRGARTVACEREAGAVEDGRRLAERRRVSVEFVEGEVEEALPGLLPADLAVVNPPRAGLSGEVAARLSGSTLGRLIYVSCDPATLARDLKRLGPRWRIRSVQPFDPFPQTAHVETVACLQPDGEGREESAAA